MDFEIYLSLTGEKQGEVIGPVTYKGKEGLIAVSRLEHNTLLSIIAGAHLCHEIHSHAVDTLEGR